MFIIKYKYSYDPTEYWVWRFPPELALSPFTTGGASFFVATSLMPRQTLQKSTQSTAKGAADGNNKNVNSKLEETFMVFISLFHTNLLECWGHLSSQLGEDGKITTLGGPGLPKCSRYFLLPSTTINMIGYGNVCFQSAKYKGVKVSVVQFMNNQSYLQRRIGYVLHHVYHSKLQQRMCTFDHHRVVIYGIKT